MGWELVGHATTRGEVLAIFIWHACCTELIATNLIFSFLSPRSLRHTSIRIELPHPRLGRFRRHPTADVASARAPCDAGPSTASTVPALHV